LAYFFTYLLQQQRHSSNFITTTPFRNYSTSETMFDQKRWKKTKNIGKILPILSFMEQLNTLFFKVILRPILPIKHWTYTDRRWTMYCIERITHLRNPISYIWLIFSHICSNNKGILQIFHEPPFGSSKMIKHFGTDSFQSKELLLNIQ
jgi:hypothetical protein